MSRRVVPTIRGVPVESSRHSSTCITATVISSHRVGVKIISPVTGSK